MQRCADAATVARSLCAHMHMLWLSSKSGLIFHHNRHQRKILGIQELANIA